MYKRWASMAILASVGALLFSPSIASAKEKAEGTVVGTKLTACHIDRGGGCEGYLTLEPRGGGKAERMSIRVTEDTSITKGGGKAYLPGLRGTVVAVIYVKNRDENLAETIEVLQAKK
jgi:hypothetical protein